MTKKYLFSRQRFARHMDSKIEQNFDKVIRSPFTDYFTHNTEELSNDCIQSIKESMCSTVCENIDLLVREITMEKEEEQKPAKKERKKKQSPVPKVVVEEHEEEEEEEVVVVETVSKKKSPKTKKKKSTSDE
jgi:hypothetical protein